MTELYRHWDAAGDLLYVGISLSTIGRLAGHRAGGSHWFNEIARVTIERFSTRSDAADAEARAIRLEGPLYNKRGAHCGWTPSNYRTAIDELNGEATLTQVRWMGLWNVLLTRVPETWGELGYREYLKKKQRRDYGPQA